jgi:hypothetical protein
MNISRVLKVIAGSALVLASIPITLMAVMIFIGACFGGNLQGFVTFLIFAAAASTMALLGLHLLGALTLQQISDMLSLRRFMTYKPTSRNPRYLNREGYDFDTQSPAGQPLYDTRG